MRWPQGNYSLLPSNWSVRPIAARRPPINPVNSTRKPFSRWSSRASKLQAWPDTMPRRVVRLALISGCRSANSPFSVMRSASPPRKGLAVDGGPPPGSWRARPTPYVPARLIAEPSDAGSSVLTRLGHESRRAVTGQKVVCAQNSHCYAPLASPDVAPNGPACR
jgi:hypothetical protein